MSEATRHAPHTHYTYRVLSSGFQSFLFWPSIEAAEAAARERGYADGEFEIIPE